MRPCRRIRSTRPTSRVPCRNCSRTPLARKRLPRQALYARPGFPGAGLRRKPCPFIARPRPASSRSRVALRRRESASYKGLRRPPTAFPGEHYEHDGIPHDRVGDSRGVVAMFVRVLLSVLWLVSCICQPALAQSPSFSPSPFVKVAVNPASNKVYVVHEFENTVTAYDESAGTSVTIPVGRRPQFVAVNPLTNLVYVNNGDDSTITVIDGATDTNITPTALNMGTQGPIAVNAPTNIVYIVRMSTPARDEVSFLNGATNEWYTIATGSYEPTAMALNPLTNTIFVAHYATGDVRVISGFYDTADDFPETTSIPAWTHPFAITVNPVTNKAYVITEDSRGPIGIIDGASKTADFRLPLAGHAQGPKSIAVNPVTNKVYAVFNDEVIVIDGATNAYRYVPIGTTGAGPASIAINATTNRIYVATSNGSFVTIDGASDTVTGRQSIPSGPESRGINPITHTAYVFGDPLARVNIDATASSPVPITATIFPLPA